MRRDETKQRLHLRLQHAASTLAQPNKVHTSSRGKGYSRSNQLRILLLRDTAAFLDNAPDNIVLLQITPQMYTHSLFTIEERVRNASDLAEHHIGNRPGIAVLLEGADVEADALFDDVVLAVGDEERPVREVNNRGHDDDAREEGGVVKQGTWQADQGGYVFRRCQTLCRVDFARLRGKQDLAGLHADVDAFYAAETEIASGPVQHYGAAGVYHVGLEEHFVNVAVVGDDVGF
jgi:hypothetical protein